MTLKFHSQKFTQRTGNLQVHKNLHTHTHTKKTYTQKFIAALFLVAKKWKPKYPSTDGWMNKCGIFTEQNIQP